MTRQQSAAAELAAYLRNSPDVAIGDVSGLNVAPRSAATADAPQVASQSIVLPVPPSANRYWRNYGGRTVVSEAARAYKSGVWLVAQHAGMHPFVGPVALYVHVYRARKVGDLDNANKILLDSLQGVAYNDDAQIVELHSWRHDDAQNPRVEVEIRKVEVQP